MSSYINIVYFTFIVADMLNSMIRTVIYQRILIDVYKNAMLNFNGVIYSQIHMASFK